MVETMAHSNTNGTQKKDANKQLDSQIEESLEFFEDIFGMIPDTFKQVPREYLES